MFLLRMIQALNEFGVSYALAGGYAVGLHGAVRGTLDVDIVIPYSENAFERAESALNSIGLESRLPVDAHQVFHFKDEYIQKRQLNAWSFYNPERPSEIVDILIGSDLKKMKTKTVFFGRHKILIVSLNDLIRMKQKSGREQDLADIQALREIQKKRKR